MNKVPQSQPSDLKLTFHVLLVLSVVPLNIGIHGALFHFVWLPCKQFIPLLIPFGLVLSMLWAGMITPAFTLLLDQYRPSKAFSFFFTGVLAVISFLGIDCFRLVAQEFNPKHTTKFIDFLRYNFLSLDFTLERLSDALHASMWHALYYFGTLTLSILFFYKKDGALSKQQQAAIDVEGGGRV